MTKDELLDKAIYWFRVIAEDMERITSGNLPHKAATTRGRAIRAYEFLEKHKNDEDTKHYWKPSDEQIEALEIAITFVTDDFGENPTLSETLRTLIEQLKKLRYE